MLKRCWVNQPSTLQVHHKHHGARVLADFTSYHPMVRVYFTGGVIISCLMHASALSGGWPEEVENAHPV